MSRILNYLKIERVQLLIAFVFSFVLRVIYLIHFNDPNFINQGDNLQYYTFAKEILNQGIWVKDTSVGSSLAGNWAMLGPGYPLLISCCLFLFGSNFFSVFILNALLTSTAIIVLYYLTKEIINDNKAAIIILVWGIFYVNFYKYTPFLLKESLVLLLLPTAILFLIKEIKNDKNFSINILWFLLTYGYLIHSDERYFFYFPFIILFFVFKYKNNFRLYIVKQFIILLGVVFLMIPWTIRNYSVYGQVVILTERTTKVTALFWGKDLSKQTNSKVLIGKIEDINSYVDSIKNGIIPLALDSTTVETIKWGITNNLVPHKFDSKEKYCNAVINFWKPTYFNPTYINDGFRKQQWSLGHNLLSLLFYGIFLPFYFIALLYILIKKEDLVLYVIATIPIIQMIIHVGLVHVLERYRNPIDCFVVIIALWFLIFLSKKMVNYYRRNQ